MFRICILRTLHLESDLRTVLAVSSIFDAYCTRTITKKAYHSTSVTYFLAKIEAYRTIPTYRIDILACSADHISTPRSLLFNLAFIDL